MLLRTLKLSTVAAVSALGTVICLVAGGVAMSSSGVGVLISETGRRGGGGDPHHPRAAVVDRMARSARRALDTSTELTKPAQTRAGLTDPKCRQ
jgi:hypothetical protein